MLISVRNDKPEYPEEAPIPTGYICRKRIMVPSFRESKNSRNRDLKIRSVIAFSFSDVPESRTGHSIADYVTMSMYRCKLPRFKMGFSSVGLHT